MAAAKPKAAAKVAATKPKTAAAAVGKHGTEERLDRLMISRSAARLEICAKTPSKPRLCILSRKLGAAHAAADVAKFVQKAEKMVRKGTTKTAVLAVWREWFEDA